MRVQQIVRTIVIVGLWLALFSMTMEAKTKVTSQPFGKMPDGTPIEIFTLSEGRTKHESQPTAGSWFP